MNDGEFEHGFKASGQEYRPLFHTCVCQSLILRLYACGMNGMCESAFEKILL